MELIILVGLSASLFNTGLIWVIQAVHYPSFKYVNLEQYQQFQVFHMKAILKIVAPSMIIEALLAFSLLFYFDVLETFEKLLVVCINLLVIFIWLHTMLLASPIHAKLVQRHDKSQIDRLISVNRWRALAWSLVSILQILFAARILHH